MEREDYEEEKLTIESLATINSYKPNILYKIIKKKVSKEIMITKDNKRFFMFSIQLDSKQSY